MKFMLREAAMDVMINNDDLQFEPMIGSFWYDPKANELFGVYSVLADDVNFYFAANNPKARIRTGRRLHKDIWKKECYRKKDPRFVGDYTRVPRGRVFEVENEGFKVYVGDWIDKYPECKELILDEFQLPPDTEFIKDIHWNIGHGWDDVIG